MAELDPALQDEINNLQTRTTALTDAVRNYSGGNIAQATNDLLAAQAQTESTIDEREAALLGLIQRNTTQPVPSLLSDFATRTYMTGVRRLEHGVGIHDMWTVSRSSVRWVWGPNGKLVEVASDQPAYAYDPETGGPLGISIEPTRTNLLTESNDATLWKFNNITITTSSKESPFGTTSYHVSGASAGTISADADTFRRSVNVTPDVEYTVNMLLSSDVEQTVTLRVYRGGVSSYLASVPIGPGWKEYSVSSPINSGDALIVIVNTPDGEFYYSYGGVEEGGGKSSPIVTDDASVTREADVLRRDLGDEYNPNGFSIYAEALQRSDIGSVFYLNTGGLSNSIRVGLPSNGDNALFVSTNGNIQAAIPIADFAGYTIGGPAKILLAVDPDNGQVRLTINGETMTRNVSEFPALDEERIGGVSGNNNNINGTVHDYIKYPTAITASEAEAMTS